MKKQICLTFLFFLLLAFSALRAQEVPQIGAQVWIEPGQSQAEIDSWFKTLAEHNMPVARLFIMWNYIETQPGKWDFSLYDMAFRAAEKHGVTIQATLTANHGAAHTDSKFWYKWQDGLMPQSQNQLSQAEKYIEQVVKRYKTSPALENWWLQNEPGQLNSHDPLAMSHFKDWLEEKYQHIDSLNAHWTTNFESFQGIEYAKNWDGAGGFTDPTPYLDWNIFWRDYLTWYMNWVAEQIRQHDKEHPLHVNPHGIFDILPKYDLPGWRGFLSSLGASIHPSWHFGLFRRDQYALGVSAVCDIIKGAIEPKPFWISELQGGNNIWSGGQPLCPTPDDISQWVWTGVGAGAKKVIFWCLNARHTGGEAGEWSLMTFQDKPSERLEEAAQIAQTIEKNKDFFRKAEPAKSPATIILSPETMLILSRKDLWNDLPGRGAQAHIQSALGFYQAFQELGISVNLKQSDDFDWQKAHNQLVVLPNMASVPTALIPQIETFVKNGNKLIVSGLSGYFDEHEHNVLLDQFPLSKVFGGSISEFKLIANEFPLQLNGISAPLPVHLWQGEIAAQSGEPQATTQGKTTALRNAYGKGEVLWIPSMIGLGGWLYDNTALAALLQRESRWLFSEIPFRFAAHTPGLLMKTLENKGEYLTILTNNTLQEKQVLLETPQNKTGEIIYGSPHGQHPDKGNFVLSARKTLVVRWK